MQSKLLINVLGILLLCVAIFVGYMFFFSEEEEQVGLSVSESILAGNSELSPETSEFLLLLESLNEVDLSGDIFNNQVFASELVNFRSEIADRPQGRANPFAPLGTANLDSQSSFNSSSRFEIVDDNSTNNSPTIDDTEATEADASTEFDEDYLGNF